MANKHLLRIHRQKEFTACTLIARNQLHYAKVLAESFIAHNPGWDFIIYICDIFEEIEDLIEPIEAFARGYEMTAVYGIREYLDFPELEEMLLRFSCEELRLVLKPHVFKYLFARGYKKAVCADASFLALAPLDEIERDLDAANIIVPSHDLPELMVDPADLTDEDSLKGDLLSRCFIAMNNDKETSAFIDWWKAPVKQYNFSRPESTQPPERRPGDYSAANAVSVKLITQKKYNAAYWSMHGGNVTRDGNDWLIDDDRIIFYQFAGRGCGINGDPAVETLVSGYNNALSALARYYSDRINEKSPERYTGKTNFFSRNRNREMTVPEFIDSQYRDIRKVPLRINLAGYFSNILGISEIARSFVRTACKSGIHFSLLDVVSHSHPILPDRDVSFFKAFRRSEPSAEVTLSFFSQDTIESISNSHPGFFNNKYVLGMWWWEIQDYFPFEKSFNYVDRILVCSDFVKNAIKPFTGLDVTKITYPFYHNWSTVTPRDTVRGQLGIEKNEFVFIFNFDFNSSIRRKNPEAVIRAFDEAFGRKDRVRIIFKSVNAEMHDKTSRLFKKIIGASKIKNKILWINRGMSREEWISLLNASDCYITLHRSEGLGLGILEAMYLGKPVITTAYGGCMDICSDANSLLVNYDIVPVADNSTVYGGGAWAEPKQGAAASHMKNIAGDNALYKCLAERAALEVRETYNPRKSLLELYRILLEYYGVYIDNYFELT